MSTRQKFFLLIFVAAIGFNATVFAQTRKLSANDYVDKMKGGWIGQMAGVGQSAPTEFKWNGVICPEGEMPAWKDEMVNQFDQDDIYVEMTFLRTLEMYGLDVTAQQAGIDFANSDYNLWHANMIARNNLRSGIAPPDSGHPQFGKHTDDIDYQIEADFSGLISPGMPNMVIEFGEKFGTIMNYGDGLYGGQFVAGMYAEAFFERDVEKIVRAGLRCIPEQSQYAECVRDVLRWHAENPDDWEKSWSLINEKYQKNPRYRSYSCTGPKADFNIDAKINGAYIVMGLLYGEGDIEKTIVVSARCGQDSDCNPSSAAGVLCTSIGFSKLPEKYKSALDENQKFSYTTYNFPGLADVCEKLARQVVVRADGRIEKRFFNLIGEDMFVIKTGEAVPGRNQQSQRPGPISNSKYTEEEMKLITGFTAAELYEGLNKFAPGWEISYCGNSTPRDIPGLHEEKSGRKNVFVTHPFGNETGCVLSKVVEIPADKKTVLKLTVGHHLAEGKHPDGDWELVVKADGEAVLSKIIGKGSCEGGWTDIDVDLSKFAGKTVKLELVNQTNELLDERYEIGYWQKIELVTE